MLYENSGIPLVLFRFDCHFTRQMMSNFPQDRCGNVFVFSAAITFVANNICHFTLDSIKKDLTLPV